MHRELAWIRVSADREAEMLLKEANDSASKMTAASARKVMRFGRTEALDEQTIRKQYHLIVRTTHPDQNPSIAPEVSHARTAELNEANKCLLDDICNQSQQ